MKSRSVRIPSQDKHRVRSNVLFVFLGMALTAPLFFLKPALARRAARSDARPAEVRNLPALSGVNPRAPWGELEYHRFAVSQPEHYLPDSAERLPAPEWHFEKTTAEQLAALFNSAETSPSVRQMLLDTNLWQISSDAIIVRPTLDIVLQLGRPARERIYAVLAHSAVNMPQYYPFRFRVGALDQWFADSQLPTDKLAQVRSLTYTNGGGAVCLADLNVVQAKLEPEEFRRFFETLYSEQSLLLSLRLTPTSDLRRLAQYWGTGGRERDVLALLKSVARSGRGSIDVVYLLPSFARMRLYRFGVLGKNSVAGQDCFWTALNFFRSEGEAQTATANRSLEILMTQYAETLEPPRFGDVILFLENRRPAHACVYVADEVVFTKNGANDNQPWVLTKLNDILPRYATDRPMSIVVLRQKTT